ncbi:MAG: amidohydrolase [Chloroflexia bacterium]|nr:amidohydrolase [Chloroflexia bacterium]
MPDLIFYNAKIATMDAQYPVQEAIAIKYGKIFAIGKNDKMLKLAKPTTKKIDVGGKLILPGFIDCHLHILAGGERLFYPNLRNAYSKEEFVCIIENNLKNYKPGDWILGGDWNNENWGGELPSKEWIDKITPQNPVWIKRLDGHMGLANSHALNIAGIDNSVQEIAGGEIFRYNDELSGIFKDNAMQLLENALPLPGFEQKKAYLKAAMNYLAERGVTGAHHLNLFEPSDFELFENTKQSKELITRLYISFPLKITEKEFAQLSKLGKGDEWTRYGVLKGFLDGSLGSQTARFFNNYKGSNKNGLYINYPHELEELVKKADDNNLQVAIHAIGDKANHELLNIYENVINKNGKKDRRFRIEHSQHIRKEDIKRFNHLDVIASMQPLHLVDDGNWLDRVIENEAITGSYNFNSLLKSNAKLAFGSDWFVSEPSPILGIHAAVNRQTLDGKHPDGWLPSEKISVLEAVKAYTIDAAYASFEENIKGSLLPGKLADLVILDNDIFTIDQKEIKETKVLATIVGGKVIYGTI